MTTYMKQRDEVQHILCTHVNEDSDYMDASFILDTLLENNESITVDNVLAANDY